MMYSYYGFFCVCFSHHTIYWFVQRGQENIPEIERETHRLAIVDMDWAHVKVCYWGLELN
jgi:hypothetical protein